MSNEYEFKVHNFYNYTLEELPELKEEFEASVRSLKVCMNKQLILKKHKLI